MDGMKSSNRTFMELKSINSAINYENEKRVLIAPLWN